MTAVAITLAAAVVQGVREQPSAIHVYPATASAAVRFDRSGPLASVTNESIDQPETAPLGRAPGGLFPPNPDDGEISAGKIPRPSSVGAPAIAVEQRAQGTRPALPVLASFDGLGAGFIGPQGTGRFSNPSDNSLAVGPDHIVQIVNGGMAVFTKKGRLFDTTGKALYGPMRSNAIFAGFGGPCEARNSGDVVVRYDQLASRWLYVVPVFQRGTTPPIDVTRLSRPGQPGQPGQAAPTRLINTPAPPPAPPPPPRGAGAPAGGNRGRGAPPTGPPFPPAPPPQSPYSMCYAVSTTTDPLGPYFRYEFLRPLFPDYPRPAVWPDGYYNPSSTSDDFIQKHACVADRIRMLQGLPATEQCIVIDGVNFLNNADIDGQGVPPDGAPNIVMAAGGEQLHQRFEDDGIYAWQFHVDWNDPSKTGLRGPLRIPVAPYHYLCNGQLTKCVPQPGDSNRLDSQGDKLVQRLVYRNVNGHESILAHHSINTSVGGGGVRWYEFRLNEKRDPVLYQQGTYAPDSAYRWLPSIGMDRKGNIGMGYSFGGPGDMPGQRFAARLAGDPSGQLSFHESVLVTGEAVQPRQLRWEDYTTTAMDPGDDCTFWYVGDYVKKDATAYSSKIGAFRVPGCREGTVAGSAFFDINHNGVRDGAETGVAGYAIQYSGGPSGTLVTDAAGAFTVTLPADSVYGNPSYTFAAAVPPRSGWKATIPMQSFAAGVTRTAAGFRVQLGDRDFVTDVAFGSVCTMTSRGAHPLAFWSSAPATALMAKLDTNWTRLFDSIYVATATGARVRLFGGTKGWDTLSAWIPGAMQGTDVQRRSVALAVAGLNVVSESIDGNATVADPVFHDWLQIRALLGRASIALGRGDSNAADYLALVDKLNDNAATITPTKPSSCPGTATSKQE